MGIPSPVFEYRFHPKRRWRFDIAWPELMIALEVDGGIWTSGRHTRGKGYLGDIEKRNEATKAGWRMLQTTPSELYSLKTAGDIKAVIQLIQNHAKS